MERMVKNRTSGEWRKPETRSPVVNRVDVKVHKPDERVLVHGVDVGQVCDAEEQHRRMLGDGPVAFSRLCYFELCFFCNLAEEENQDE